MFEFIKKIYEGIKDKYTPARVDCEKSENERRFFKSIFDYFFRIPQGFIFSENDKRKFEGGLDRKVISNYNINYGKGEIILTRKPYKDLTERL